MRFSDDLSADSIIIKRFIFHVIHQGADEPILLDETPLGKYEHFFAERIIETIEGNRFLFNQGSFVQEKLSEISKDDQLFVRLSKAMATHFHSFENKNIKAGVVIFMKVEIEGQPYFSIIKYDHEEVLAYKLDEDNRKAILEDVANSFTKSKESLHKSALIELTELGGNVFVIDKKVREDISKFFKGFLNIKRQFDSAELTKKVEEITIDVVKKNRDKLPADFTANIKKMVFDATQGEDNYSFQSYYDKIFGLVGDEQLKTCLIRELKKNDLDGEVFAFDKEALKEPRKRKIKTKEGIKIQYDDSSSDRIKFYDENDGTKRIEIRTEQYYDEK